MAAGTVQLFLIQRLLIGRIVACCLLLFAAACTPAPPETVPEMAISGMTEMPSEEPASISPSDAVQEDPLNGALNRFGDGAIWAMSVAEEAGAVVVGSGIGLHAYHYTDSHHIEELWRQISARPVTSVAVSADGTLVASISELTLSLWDGVSGAWLRDIGPALTDFDRMALSPDGRTLALASERTVTLWDTSTGELIERQQMLQQIIDLAWSPDGAALALGSRHLLLWEIALGEPPYEMPTDASWGISRMQWSADGATLAAGLLDGSLLLWDLTAERYVHIEEGHALEAASVALSTDKTQVVTGGQDGTIILWDAATGEQVATLYHHTHRVVSLAFMPDGGLLSGSKDSQIVVWDPGLAEARTVFDAHTAAVNVVAWSHDGTKIASGGMDGAVNIWDVQTGARLVHLGGHMQPVTSLAWSPDGLLLASGSHDKSAILWEVSSGRVLRRFQAIWPTVRREYEGVGPVEEVVGPPTGHTGAVLAVSFSPDGMYLATGGADALVLLWDLSVEHLPVVLEGHSGPVDNVLFLDEGSELLSTSAYGTIVRWSVPGGELVNRELHHGYTNLAISPEGDVFAALNNPESGGPVVVWRIGDEEVSVEEAMGQVMRLRFDTSGRRLVGGLLGDLQSVGIVDVETGTMLQTITGHSFDMKDAAFSPDGNILATVSWDGTIMLWAVDGGE